MSRKFFFFSFYLWICKFLFAAVNYDICLLATFSLSPACGKCYCLKCSCPVHLRWTPSITCVDRVAPSRHLISPPTANSAAIRTEDKKRVKYASSRYRFVFIFTARPFKFTGVLVDDVDPIICKIRHHSETSVFLSATVAVCGNAAVIVANCEQRPTQTIQPPMSRILITVISFLDK